MDKKRLRRWLLLFFLALALPAALLIQQSYSRLKWETFHQYQKMASELSQRIDNRLTQLVAAEDKRTFADYSFLNAAGDAKANLIQRSPLSNYPIESDIPGVIGYFQVDAQGVLITPLVPPADENSYGVDQDELAKRVAIQNQIQQILAANQLVRAAPPSEISISANVAKVGTSSFSSQSAASQAFSRDKLDSSASRASATLAQSDIGSIAEELQEVEAESLDSIALGMSVDAEADAAIINDKVSFNTELASPQPQTQSQPLAFEQLKKRTKQVASKNNYERLEDIPLKQNYQQKSEEKKRKTTVRQARESAPTRRTTATKKQVERAQIVLPAASNDIRIRTFESEVDPFEFSQLDSGHFVLFRKVWLNGQRYTQGLLIEQEQFLSLIRNEFLTTGLSTMSSVLIAYQGNLLATLTETISPSYAIKTPTLVGEELYQTRLSDPLSDLQMIYSIKELPIGAGGRLILWLALIMASVLLGGFYLMYRLGLRQINLANQQQDFVSAVSHELKTPLTSIRMYGEILKQGWASEEKKRSYYDFIYEESERLSRLINNVLQLARMNRNEQPPELAVCNVEALLREIESKITSQIEAAEFKLTIESDDSASALGISIDRDWLAQVMINLVDNAIKFSAKSARKEVIVSVSQSGKKQVEFTVSDFGPGIDKQQMKAIFELFYRSENELTRDTVGTGIGLSLVHQMVTSMGGKVSVKNREPSAQNGAKLTGASFSVTFPIATVPDIA